MPEVQAQSTILRYSSRLQPLAHTFLRERLSKATSYKRIAGYFRSSIFELVGEEIAGIPDVRILCNSELDAADIAVSQAARAVALKERWNQAPVEVEALLQRERYQRLYDLLSQGNVQIRVVPKERTFIHGKAGVIETPEGKTCFLGSINETRSAFTHNYEILWEDTSPEGVAWVEAEFEALWAGAYELPEAIVNEVRRVAERVEVSFPDVTARDLPAATLAEAPIYRGGEQLQPWQRAFVALFLEHRERYGQVRLLLADEVGLGKTLSLAAGAMVAALLGDGPVLILCPSGLTLQWQVELKDRLGIPSAVWHSTKKQWIDPNGHVIKTRGAGDVVGCPFRIAIVSTGLIFHGTEEKDALLNRSYGTVILDEAHRARRRGVLGNRVGDPNNLLEFMGKIAQKTKHLLLGTATPIQTEVSELWDLMQTLNGSADFVLGRNFFTRWADWETALPLVKGTAAPADLEEAWALLRAPLPPGEESTIFASLRLSLSARKESHFSDRSLRSLDPLARSLLSETLEPDFFREHNPILRHTVLRRRDTLEEAGLLERIEVQVHPEPDGGAAYPGVPFHGQNLLTNHPFRVAYEAVGEYTKALARRRRANGFMKSLLQQRICSSFASGRATAGRLLRRELPEEEEDAQAVAGVLQEMSNEEIDQLRIILHELSLPEARDPKLDAVKYFLTRHRSERKTFLEHGCIIFSQYYDTAHWVASELAVVLPGEAVALYAGVGKSGIFRNGAFNSVGREEIKAAVKRRELRLLVATDAACEGLNLQTLGTLINIDLPWNPSRLEQRLGRIKRFGQGRRRVDMVNLVYAETQDEKVYAVLSRRMKDRFDIFGGLPDTIEDEWIENIETLEEKMDQYLHLRDQARDVFELRYQSTISPDDNRWELCSRVISRQDIVERLSEPW